MAMEVIAGRKSFNIGYSPDMACQFDTHLSGDLECGGVTVQG
jgi:hypothetical protein